MISHLLTQPATITPRTESGRDTYGNPITVDGTEVDTFGFWQQDGESDSRTDEDQATSDGWLFLLPSATIARTDRVEIAGVTLEVVGRPRRPTRPSLGEHHVEVRARLVEG